MYVIVVRVTMYFPSLLLPTVVRMIGISFNCSSFRLVKPIGYHRGEGALRIPYDLRTVGRNHAGIDRNTSETLKAGSTIRNRKMADTLVLFDIGRVLAEIDHTRMYARLARVTDMTPEQVRARVEHSGYDNAIDAGRVETFRWTLRRVLGRESIPDSFLDEAYLILHTGPHTPVVEIKEQVRLVAPVGLLTNSHVSCRRYLESRWPGTLRADGPHGLSDVEGALKPHPEIYEPLRDAAERIIFVDDLPENLLHPITALGWTGIRYAGLRPVADVPSELRGHPRYREAASAHELAQHLTDLRVLR